MFAIRRRRRRCIRDSLKLVALLDIPELFATLDSIAERWGDFDVSGTVPEPLSHDL